MSKQGSRKPIRRCRNCNNMAHHMHWGGERCPFCGAVAGYHLGNHGGKSRAIIAVKRVKTIKLLLQLKEDGAISQEEEERLNWLKQKHRQEKG